MVSRPDRGPRNPQMAAVLALAVASGESVRSAASRLGIPGRTAKRWAASEAFKAKVQEHRASFTDQALGRLTALAVGAVDVMGELMKEADSDSTRLAAAKAVLDKLPSLHEFFAFADRIAQLEARVGSDAESKGARRW